VGSQTSLASSAAGPPAAELRLCSSRGHWAWAIGKRREKVRKDRTQGVFLFCGGFYSGVIKMFCNQIEVVYVILFILYLECYQIVAFILHEFHLDKKMTK
jgi:hypothetical protein